MARTILEIAQEAAEREGTAPPPRSLFGNNSRVARILRHAAKDTMREYLRLVGWESQSELQSTWTFTLRPGRFAYNLPPDFLRSIPRTEHRNGWEMGLIGPADAVTWASWLMGSATVTAPMGWRVRNGMLMIEPTPADTELVSIDYITRYPVVSNLTASDYDFNLKPIQPKSPFVPLDGHLDLRAATDVITIDEDDARYEDGDVGYEVGTWPDELWEVLKRINPMSGVAPLPKVRRPEFTADTDMPAWQDDFLLSLGMNFRLRRGLGMPFAEAAAEYEAEMDTKANTDGGGKRAFALGSNTPQAETVPLGGGRWLLS